MQWDLCAQTLSAGLVQEAMGKGTCAAELVHKDLSTGPGPDLCITTSAQ